jgi:hypothetical protein
MLIVSTSGNNSPNGVAAMVARVLHGYAQSLAASLGGTMHLAPPTSTALSIQTTLARNGSRAFAFFGHGVSAPGEGFVAECGNVAVDRSNVTLLSGRSVAATSCHGDRVGTLASGNGFSMSGYVGRLEVPIVAPYTAQMEPAATRSAREIARGASARMAAVSASKDYSILAQTLYATGQPLDAFAAIMFSKNASAVASWP